MGGRNRRGDNSLPGQEDFKGSDAVDVAAFVTRR